MWIVEPAARRYGAPAEPSAPGSGLRRVELAGAVNETLSFTFGVRPDDAPVENASIRVTPLRSVAATIDPSAVEVFRMHAVRVEKFPGWHVRSIPPDQRNANPLDVLVPLAAPRGGLPRIMQSRETCLFWVDVAIPKGTPDGLYAGAIELASGDAKVATVDVHLTVFPFALPDQADIPVIAEVDYAGLFRRHVDAFGSLAALDPHDWQGSALRGDLQELLLSTLRMLQSHALTPVLPDLAPRVSIDALGKLSIDWSGYDALVEPCLSGTAFANRIPLAWWPMPFHGMFSSRRHGDTIASPTHAALLREYLARCAEHFAERGWLDRSYVTAPFPASAAPSDRRGFAEDVERLTDDFVVVTRRADERISIVSRYWPQDMEPYGWPEYRATARSGAEGRGILDVDIWAPPAQFYDPESMASELKIGRRAWLTVDRPPFSGSVSIYAPPGYVRVLTWQAKQLGAQAVYVGCVNSWPDAVDHPTPQDCVRADPDVLLYPGRFFGLDRPVASVRLKRLRRSVQDAAYRTLLNRRGLEYVTATLRNSLAPYAGSEAYRTHFADGRPIGWVHNAGLFDLAREIMADTLIDASHDELPAQRSANFSRNAAWRRFMLTARRLYACVDGTRMRLRGTRTVWETDVECAVTITNGKRTPVSGSIRFADLPAGWTVEADGQPFETIPPNGSRRVILSARATASPAAVGAAARVTAPAPGDNRRSRTARVRLPGGGETARSLPIELTTDDGVVHRFAARVSCVTAVPFDTGRLGIDRSIRIDGNLSDWPLGSANVASHFRLIAGGSAHHATTAFIMRDRKHLYIAVNCAGGASAISRRNYVEYDDLIPVGDELIEILIDPLNSGTRSPTDLYHVVVKPGGTYLTEKGIRFDPPCGRSAPWAADIEVATQTQPGRWTVELRIPFASFDGDAPEHTIWGFNVTRYDASNQEFSTWSGASGNAYDPLSLGNLYLP